jgi:hypothetical protein
VGGPASAYVFKILDSQSEGHIVRICNHAEAQVRATILAKEATRNGL